MSVNEAHFDEHYAVPVIPIVQGNLVDRDIEICTDVVPLGQEIEVHRPARLDARDIGGVCFKMPFRSSSIQDT